MDLGRKISLISSPDDVRLAAFNGMRDRELARQGGRFIAEGEHLLRRLLASTYQTESVLLAARRADELAPLVPEHVPVYVAPAAVLNQIVGFKFHSGVLACGLRGPRRTLEQVLPAKSPISLDPDDPRTLRIVICEEINNTENLGGIIRIAAGFGADALVLGERCADPFFRRCVRVSMGTLFHMPLVQSLDLIADLTRLREEWNLELAATVLSADAQPLADAVPSPRMGLLFGGEAQGLSPAARSACHRQITIPMQLGTDSLNVAVAAGIMMYHFCGRGKANEQRTTINKNAKRKA